MRLVIQRVSEASVHVNGALVGRIGKGLLVLCGVCAADTSVDAEWLAQKVVQMRIFSDAAGKMNLSVADIGGEVLVVSQFTLHAATAKGNRPGFTAAAPPLQAVPLYEMFLSLLERQLGKPVQKGVFGADMKVGLLNDGPVTICMDSQARE